MFILCDLYFDGVDDDEHVGDFDAFSSGHSQYLAFSFVSGGFDDKGPFSLNRFSMYIYSFLGLCLNTRN